MRSRGDSSARASCVIDPKSGNHIEKTAPAFAISNGREDHDHSGWHDGAMGARWLIAMLLTGGCDVVYGLEDRPPIDARVADADANAAIDAPVDMMIDALVCPIDYIPIAGTLATSRYRIVTDGGRNWIYALDDCRNDTPGIGFTHLVVFDDTVELDRIQKALPPMSGFLAWVGYGRDITDGPLDFRSVTNVSISDMSPLWVVGEPNNGTGNETVVWIANNNSGMVDAQTTDTVGGYVCECDFVPTIGFEFNVD